MPEETLNVNSAMALPDTIYAFGFSRWKQQLLLQFLPDKKILLVKYLNQTPNDATLLIWGHRSLKSNCLPTERNIKVLSVEDGFLRSVGLGAEFQMRPLSWVIDRRGIYYDATTVSDLEYLLQTSIFLPTHLMRAQRLREHIIEYGLTKYNVGMQIPIELDTKLTAIKHLIILVPGQVETDASLAFSAPQIRQNLALLQTVRSANPDAYIIYKPHPDVVAGLRTRGEQEYQAQNWCNEIITDIAMDKLLDYIDEVHVLTSLTGFEALLRDKKVVCYGQPFYAGWGLTTDQVPIERRTRCLSLDELVAGTLILYPLYLSSVNNRLITVEQAIEELLAWKTNPTKFSWFDKLARFIHKKIKFTSTP